MLLCYFCCDIVTVIVLLLLCYCCYGIVIVIVIVIVIILICYYCYVINVVIAIVIVMLIVSAIVSVIFMFCECYVNCKETALNLFNSSCRFALLSLLALMSFCSHGCVCSRSAHASSASLQLT